MSGAAEAHAIVIDEEGGGGADGEEVDAEHEERAVQLGIVQNPQDGSADTAISLALSSSFITYSPATLQRLQDFFHIEEVSSLRCTVLVLPMSCGRLCLVETCKINTGGMAGLQRPRSWSSSGTTCPSERRHPPRLRHVLLPPSRQPAHPERALLIMILS